MAEGGTYVPPADPSAAPDAQRGAPGSRPAGDGPLQKLSCQLLATYSRINKVYYQKKRQRQSTRDRLLGRRSHDFQVQEGEMLERRYRVHKSIGKGSFGQVVVAYDTHEPLPDKPDEYKKVAIKVIKAKDAFRRQAKTELKLLRLLNRMDPDDQWGVVRLMDQFDKDGHVCLVFELLSLNLYELLRRTKYKGVSLALIRKFARQILRTLAFLSLPDIDVVHCDLKPENILFRVPNRSSIKIVDFGSSCKRKDRAYVYIQSRFYRSPEAILGLPYDQAIDMWSLGCILVEMHTGVPLFSGRDELDQISRFVTLKGLPPRQMLREANKTRKFFLVNDPRAPTVSREAADKATKSKSGGRLSSKESLRRADARETGLNIADERLKEALSLPEAYDGEVERYEAAAARAKPAVAGGSGAAGGGEEGEEGEEGEVAGAEQAAVPPQVATCAQQLGVDPHRLMRRRQLRKKALSSLSQPGRYLLLPKQANSKTSSQTPATDLREVLGVHKGGPGGRRRAEPEGHTPRDYALFMDLVERMLEWDPRRRIRPMEALNHPFLRDQYGPVGCRSSGQQPPEGQASGTAGSAMGGSAVSAAAGGGGSVQASVLSRPVPPS